MRDVSDPSDNFMKGRTLELRASRSVDMAVTSVGLSTVTVQDCRIMLVVISVAAKSRSVGYLCEEQSEEQRIVSSLCSNQVNVERVDLERM